MNKVSNLTSSNAISTCMSDESAHGYVFNRTLVCKPVIEIAVTFAFTRFMNDNVHFMILHYCELCIFVTTNTN